MGPGRFAYFQRGKQRLLDLALMRGMPPARKRSKSLLAVELVIQKACLGAATAKSYGGQISALIIRQVCFEKVRSATALRRSLSPPSKFMTS